MTIHVPSILVVFFVILSSFAILLAVTYILMREWDSIQERTPHFDELTGLYTRGTIKNRICQHLNQRNQTELTTSRGCVSDAFILLDLDGFKQINDSCGHPSGDRLLSGVAALLLQSTRCSDIVGRLGGDEFIVFLTNLPSTDIARKKADILLKNIRLFVQDHPHWDGVSASFGIALVPHHGSTFEELYCKADAALYEAKHAGKDQICVYKLKQY